MTAHQHNSEPSHGILAETVKVLSEAFQTLERHVGKPVLTGDGIYRSWRYPNPHIKEAVVLKLARTISGLHSIDCLIQHGMFQEIGALCRMLDEYGEDVIFLGQALVTGDVTALHTEYLDSFFKEEFENANDPLGSEQKRKIVSRQKIHAAITRTPGHALNPSDAKTLSRTLSQAMSGYVHAAACHVMDMYTGYPPRFHLTGMLGTHSEPQVRKQVYNYFYRGLGTVEYAALTFKESTLAVELRRYRSDFEQQVGMTDWPGPEKMIARLKKPKP